MPYAMDPAVVAALEPLLAAAGDAPPPPPGDVATRRTNGDALFAFIAAQAPQVDGVTSRDLTVEGHGGGDVMLRWYTPAGLAAGGPAIYYIHGGGMIFGTVEQYDALVRGYVADTGVPVLAVDYRLAPEFPHPTPVEDCYAGLAWMAKNAAELGIDPARIAVAGDSAGGGLSAGVTLLARDRGGPALARQILIYPMLDDRTVVRDENLAPFLTWTYEDNITGWQALLGDAHGSDDVPHYAAPARATDLSGLPPTYVDVGELDIFRDEDVDYARRIASTGTPVELHLHPAVPHAYEVFAPTAEVSRRTRADRLRWMTGF